MPPGKPIASGGFLLAALALAGCSGPAAPRSSPSADASEATTAALPLAPMSATSAAMPCGPSNLERSTCMVQLILADLKSNYRAIGGGGITNIKAGAGMSYSVALPQEERVDILTYEFERRGNTIAIARKTQATETP